MSWKVGRSEQGRNPVLAGRGSDRLESDGGIWSGEIAGEIRRLIRVKWRAGCWGRVAQKSQSPGCPASAKREKNSTAGLSNQGEL